MRLLGAGNGPKPVDQLVEPDVVAPLPGQHAAGTAQLADALFGVGRGRHGLLRRLRRRGAAALGRSSADAAGPGSFPGHAKSTLSESRALQQRRGVLWRLDLYRGDATDGALLGRNSGVLDGEHREVVVESARGGGESAYQVLDGVVESRGG